ncbi:hypothetical protein [Nonomuraea jabiensis]|uniref:Uncharacterized protein n=1 Tax=Nonomuraea jabiensis TaxID=882448 RepID=A0A7W9LFI9_9ACTN|nr:hypothetical protein [Nonomuraea jabiensis]MBB5781962.1 hypothetical protein [Nonomuraea jabiensis]
MRDVRKEELDAINVVLAERTPVELRRELLETLEVPDGRRVATAWPAASSSATSASCARVVRRAWKTSWVRSVWV